MLLEDWLSLKQRHHCQPPVTAAQWHAALAMPTASGKLQSCKFAAWWGFPSQTFVEIVLTIKYLHGPTGTRSGGNAALGCYTRGNQLEPFPASILVPICILNVPTCAQLPIESQGAAENVYNTHANKQAGWLGMGFRVL